MSEPKCPACGGTGKLPPLCKICGDTGKVRSGIHEVACRYCNVDISPPRNNTCTKCRGTGVES